MANRKLERRSTRNLQANQRAFGMTGAAFNSA
jgi:hypothetical protein